MADRNSEKSKKSQRGSSFTKWIYLGILAVLLIQLLFFFGGGEDETVPYSDFLDYVQQGHVERLTIVDEETVEGRFTPQAVALGAVNVPDVGSDILGNPGDPYAFTSVKPKDHDLVSFLREHNAEARASDGTVVSFSAEYTSDWMRTAMLWMIPIALLVVLWIYLMRRMAPGAQALGIGKSNAVLFDSMGDDKVTFDDVAGMEEAKGEVVELVEFLKNPDRFTRLGGTLPKGVLLVGQPGTGKTLLAKAVAGEAGTPFFSLSGSDFVEMFVGVGAARVRDLFKEAKQHAPCIIFIDEIDAIGRSRGGSAMSGANDERENTLNQLLVEMDGFNTDEGVIIVAATNRPDVLDTALLRPGRFDRQIVIDKPSRQERAAIFEVHANHLTLAHDVEMSRLATQTPGFAGAEIANICNEAALLAARDDKEAVEMTDFERAIDRVIGGLEKKNKIISPEERRTIAFHEAGHAITGWFLEHADPMVKVSIVPRGLAALGYAQYLPDERYLYTREVLLDRMTMTIGGRVAEELVFNRISTGAQNDLERITKIAYAMVVDYGMSERVGPLSFNLTGRNDDAPVFDKPYADDTARLIDEEVRNIVSSVKERARALLEKREEDLYLLADTLLEREVLSRQEIEELIGPRPFSETGAASTGERQPLEEESSKGEPRETDVIP